MIRIVGSVSVVVAVLLTWGCNTVEGVGEDISDASAATKKAITGEPRAESTARGGSDSKNRD
ncbi:MAG: entericidin [Phycisphaerales bacterium]|nr:entericidin [Phycisphaerales bacterium]